MLTFRGLAVSIKRDSKEVKMSLEPKYDDSDAQVLWSFEVVEGCLEFRVKVSGSVSVDFAEHVLGDAILRRDKAVGSADGISLDLIIGGLTKEVVNDLGFVLKRARS